MNNYKITNENVYSYDMFYYVHVSSISAAQQHRDAFNKKGGQT